MYRLKIFEIEKLEESFNQFFSQFDEDEVRLCKLDLNEKYAYVFYDLLEEDDEDDEEEEDLEEDDEDEEGEEPAEYFKKAA